MKISGGTAAGLATGLVLESLGFTSPALSAQASKDWRIEYGREVTSICPYCAVGCGLLMHVREGEVIYVEGDPKHPINRGALCSKGAALTQISGQSGQRLTVPLYRPPKGREWKEVSWDYALDKITQNIYYSRERSFVQQNEKGQLVNRTEGIASIGSAALNNEECYAYQKLLRALGLVYVEHQARICFSSTLFALTESFGRGAMSNHWIDLKNSDVILIMGANPAENHPLAFKWIMRAKEKGAVIIHVDPRFTRTSAKADIYAPIRAGTDLAFLGGLINYLIENRLYCERSVFLHTNATFLVDPRFQLPDDLDGLFSGYDPKTRSYDKSTWAFQREPDGMMKRDVTLQDPHCVFNLLRKHFYRYTIEVVSRITGTPADLLRKIYQSFSATKGPRQSGTILSALGWTQHTVGTQNIRAMAIIQLLLGNMGIAGGGINTLRGESNAQGATDHSLLYEMLPGYLKIPFASQACLKDYLAHNTPKSANSHSANEWQNYPRYAVSLLKAFFGDAARADNDFGYHWLPKIEEDRNYSWLMLFDAIYSGKISGFLVWGQNPACSGANATRVRKSLASLEWLVSVDIFDNETSSFWRGPNIDPAEIETEVFLLPAALFSEKEGSITNSCRWMQWRHKVVDPPGQAKSDGEIMSELAIRLKKIFSQKGGRNSEAMVNLSWDFSTTEPDGMGRGDEGTRGQGDEGNGKTMLFDPHRVAREINGSFLKDVRIADQLFGKGALVPHQSCLRMDGSTSCGNWLYCSSYTKEGPMAARRDSSDPDGLGLYPGWAWSWPNNCRILHNRASVNEHGLPRKPNKAIIRWNGQQWVGDVPDGDWPPMGQGQMGQRQPVGQRQPGQGQLGQEMEAGQMEEERAQRGRMEGERMEDMQKGQGGHFRYAFSLLPEGLAQIFGPGMADGPFPEHYEPLECPIEKNLLSGQRLSPTIKLLSNKEISEGEKQFMTCDPKFPIVCTTYRLSEHWQTGTMTRRQPWLMELQPRVFIEMCRELAEDKGIKNGDVCLIKSARGNLEAVALVTDRLQPLLVNDQKIYQVGVPWHFGWMSPKECGDSANILTPSIGDANTMIPETKAFLVDVVKKDDSRKM